MYEAFIHMTECKNLSELTKTTEEWARKIFYVHQVKFYIVENENLTYYHDDGKLIFLLLKLIFYLEPHFICKDLQETQL